jgi:hypothetical protein
MPWLLVAKLQAAPAMPKKRCAWLEMGGSIEWVKMAIVWCSRSNRVESFVAVY